MTAARAARTLGGGSALLLGLAASSCGGGTGREEPVVWTNQELALIHTLSPLPGLREDPTNHVADDPRAARLGQRLFFDTGFSAEGSVACATCHKPSLYFTDGQQRAVGRGPVARHTPSIIGAQWSPFLFWDGRTDSMWAQALGPLEADPEHGETRLGVAHRIEARYQTSYEELFGDLPPLDDAARFPPAAMPIPDAPEDPRAQAWRSMTEEDRERVNEVYANVGKCIAAYERRLLPRAAPFDRYVASLREGDETGGDHLSQSALRGLRSFVGAAACVQCHNGPLLTDHSFHNTGLPPPELDGELDPGRAEGARGVLASPFGSGGRFSDGSVSPDVDYLNPDFDDFLGSFKTPSLRNVAMTAPYGHAGQFATLEELLQFYKRLPRVPMIGHRDLILRPLDKDLSVVDLVAFLESLTGPLPDDDWLRSPPD